MHLNIVANIVANYTQVLGERVQNTSLEAEWFSLGKKLSSFAKMAVDSANKHNYSQATDIVTQIFKALPTISSYFGRGR